MSRARVGDGFGGENLRPRVWSVWRLARAECKSGLSRSERAPSNLANWLWLFVWQEPEKNKRHHGDGRSGRCGPRDGPSLAATGRPTKGLPQARPVRWNVANCSLDCRSAFPSVWWPVATLSLTGAA